MRYVRRTPMLPYFVPETTPNFQTGEMVIKRALTSWFRNCLIITFFNVLKGFAYSSTNSHLITSSKKLNFAVMFDAKPCLKWLVFARACWEINVLLDPSSLRKRNFAFI